MWCLALTLLACRVTDQRFVEAPAEPRLIAPSSMSRVTRQAPTLRWVLGPGEGAAAVELCKDRACTRPLAIGTTLADDQLSAVPTASLPFGWVYWRVRVTRGDRVAVSATWQFWVGHPATGTPLDVDSSTGMIFDVDGDGYADLLVAAAAARAGSETGGVVHVYLGSAMPTLAGWNGPTPTRRIDIVVPANVPGFANATISPIGDLNGDGFADFMVGVPFAVDGSGMTSGAVYLYLGSEAPSADRWNGPSAPDRIDLASPDGSSATFGNPAVGLGDVNGDGYADFLVASSPFGGMQPLHVYLGSATPGSDGWTGVTPPLRVDLSNPDGVNAIFDVAASVGDVNGDGYVDFAIGTSGPKGKNEGAAHVYLGSATPSGATWSGDSPAARIDIATPDGDGGKFFVVGSAGDVNGDGFADLLVGAPAVAGGTGVAHLYLGARDPAPGWHAGSPTARIDLTSPDSLRIAFGDIVSSAGDVNGDGLADFIVSGYAANFGAPNQGTAHLYLGMRMPSASAWNTTPMANLRVDLIAPEGVASAYGDRPALAGDITGDVNDDFAVSAPDAFGQVGAVYVYFGTVAASAGVWNGAAPMRRFTIVGPDPMGSAFGGMH